MEFFMVLTFQAIFEIYLIIIQSNFFGKCLPPAKVVDFRKLKVFFRKLIVFKKILFSF